MHNTSTDVEYRLQNFTSTLQTIAEFNHLLELIWWWHFLKCNHVTHSFVHMYALLFPPVTPYHGEIIEQGNCCYYFPYSNWKIRTQIPCINCQGFRRILFCGQWHAGVAACGNIDIPYPPVILYVTIFSWVRNTKMTYLNEYKNTHIYVYTHIYVQYRFVRVNHMSSLERRID